MADTEHCCPRCGSSFHCGVSDEAPCACTGVQVDAATLAALRAQFVGCLCLGCLRQFARGGAPVAAECAPRLATCNADSSNQASGQPARLLTQA